MPDFLIWDADGYLIRDSKMSRRIDEDNHPEILLPMQTYCWLYEQSTHTPLKRLQIHSGTNDIIDVPYDGGAEAIAKLARILVIKQQAGEPYEPVGWSKCSGCGFNERCWQVAESNHDVALVVKVDQSLAARGASLDS